MYFLCGGRYPIKIDELGKTNSIHKIVLSLRPTFYLANFVMEEVSERRENERPLAQSDKTCMAMQVEPSLSLSLLVRLGSEKKL